MLEIRNLEKRFDKFIVFENINLMVNKGSIFGLVGINGAGKSTLLRCIAGVYRPEAGVVLYDSEEIYENIPVKENILFIPDDPFTSVYITGKALENLYSSYYPNFNHHEYDEVLNELNIDKNKRINTFSKGMKRRLYLALALASKPNLLLLDEAFDGLDPLARMLVKKRFIREVEERKMTIIISSHSLLELEDICDSYAILDNKNIKSSGTISNDLEKYFKVQLAFDHVRINEDFAFLNPLSISITGRIVSLVLKGQREDYEEKLNSLNPLIIDDLPLNFEDFFISSIEEGKHD